MKKYEVVKKNDDFNDIINSGKRIKSHYFNIYYKDSHLDYPKFGIAVSKKFGHAVKRNKVKRQVRSLVDHHKNLFPNFKNYIIMIRKRVEDVSYSHLEQDFVQLLKKGFFNEKI